MDGDLSKKPSHDTAASSKKGDKTIHGRPMNVPRSRLAHENSDVTASSTPKDRADGQKGQGIDASVSF